MANNACIDGILNSLDKQMSHSRTLHAAATAVIQQLKLSMSIPDSTLQCSLESGINIEHSSFDNPQSTEWDD